MTTYAVQKKPTNISGEIELLKEAKSLGLNLSAIFNNALREEIRAMKRKQFLEKNREAINSCNEFSENAGLFSDEHEIL